MATRVLAALALVAALVGGLAGCGGATEDRSAQGSGPAGSPAAALPRLTVDDVAGGRVPLRSVAAADRPLLVWFWAPH